MSVVRTPGTNDKPMIRIANKFLADANFSIGSTVEVSYERNIIIIKKLNKHEYNNLQKADSVTNLSIASDAKTF
jgi:antitoxin component of MazEF toxin-antitoxin module